MLNRKTKFALAALFVFAFAAPAFAETINRIVAIVDDEIVTEFELEIKSRPLVQAYLAGVGDLSAAERESAILEIKKRVLRDTIEQKLLETEVRRLGLPVEETDVDAYIDRLIASNRMTRADLTDVLAREGKTMTDLRDQIRKQILREQYVSFRLKDKVKVSDEDVRIHYQQHESDFLGEAKVTLSEIRFNLPAEASPDVVRETFDRAATTYEQLLAGADFDETARAVSEGPTAKNGGFLGTFAIDKDLREDYRRAAGDLKAGEVSTVFRDAAGFFILKCLARETADVRPLEEVEDQIRMDLRKETIDTEMRRLARELYTKSYVDIKVPELDPRD
ncbi:SurA N-terminal domain-containing protein [bacterium]|nr:SurA N-terminal domain-containing protein [bacterium]